MAKHNEFGKKGEERAADYLAQQGYVILERNWRVGHLELDIVCRHGDLLVVVEVKTRHEEEENPAELLGWQKRKNLLHAADAYLKMKKLDMEVRFDLIIVSGEKMEIEHIPEAMNILN